MPLIQGFVGQRSFTVDSPSGTDSHVISAAASKPEEVVAVQEDASPDPQTQALADAGIVAEQTDSGNEFLLTIISRRSINRAGLPAAASPAIVRGE